MVCLLAVSILWIERERDGGKRVRHSTEVRRPRIEIQYCFRCRWGLRAGWLAQELLATFTQELGEVALVPTGEAGRFRVILDGELIFDRSQAGRFPESRELKQLVRDQIAPERSLGHSDRAWPAED